MSKYTCSKGCPRKSRSDGDDSTRFEDDGTRIVTYNCNICGNVTSYIEKPEP